MQVKLKSITPEAEVNIVEIARVSSTRENKKEKPEGLINYLIKNKHWSPFEHSYMTLEIVTSMAIGEQLLRHRSFTFQKLSGRYAEMSEFEPIELRRQAEKNRQSSTDVMDTPKEVFELLDETRRIYKRLIELGVARECARMILPACTRTRMFMTGSVRSWIHFLEIRDDEHAQKEAQLIAKEAKKIFIENLPIISKALGYLD